MKFFTADNPVFNFISRVGDMLILSLLWFVTSLPVITIGASTTALFDCCIRIIRGRDSSVLKDFIRAFASNFRQSTVIFLIMAAIGALGALDMYFWAHSESEIATFMNAVSIGIMILFSATLLYVFPVQAVFENKIKDTVRTAFLMSLKHWKNTIVLLAVAAGIIYLCYMIPAAAYIYFIIGTGVFGMIYSVRFADVFCQHNEVIAEDMRRLDRLRTTKGKSDADDEAGNAADSGNTAV